MKRTILFISLSMFLTWSVEALSPVRLSADDSSLATELMKITPQTNWRLVDSVRLSFPTYHTQGMVKVGDFFFMTTVAVDQWPKKYDVPQGKYDRDVGVGKGYVFRFNRQGELLSTISIGEGDIYHPGGIDCDGTYLYVPVTEYRPLSRSIIYRVHIETLEVEEMFRFEDSIGALAYNRDTRTLVGANWNARLFYPWRLNEKGQCINADVDPESLGVKNPSFFINAQDCKYVGNNWMFCSGLEHYNKGELRVTVGGWELVDLTDYRMVHQTPIPLYAPSGRVMTNNPCAVELTDRGIRAYFAPDDDQTTLYIFEATTAKQ